ncbi:hypothetical protein Bbelb_439350 [Branchiostoma belcheri]|nr:hypothetical protein Bbelb_439350 [Branchiostoma belcheri]
MNYGRADVTTRVSPVTKEVCSRERQDIDCEKALKNDPGPRRTPGLGGPQLNRQPSWSSIIHTSPPRLPTGHSYIRDFLSPETHLSLTGPGFSGPGSWTVMNGGGRTPSHSHHYLAKKPSRWMGAVFAEAPLMGINPTREQPPVKAMPRRGGDLQCYRGKISRKSIVSLSSMDGVNLGLIYASCNQDLISDKPLSKLLGAVCGGALLGTASRPH